MDSFINYISNHVGDGQIERLNPKVDLLVEIRELGVGELTTSTAESWVP
jgi:hypothetical protein